MNRDFCALATNILESFVGGLLSFDLSYRLSLEPGQITCETVPHQIGLASHFGDDVTRVVVTYAQLHDLAPVMDCGEVDEVGGWLSGGSYGASG